MMTSPANTGALRDAGGFKVEKIEVNSVTGKGYIVFDMDEAQANMIREHLEKRSHIGVSLMVTPREVIEQQQRQAAMEESAAATKSDSGSIKDYTK